VAARKTPVGYIPEYEDLEALFKAVLGKDYTKEQYEQQFKLRIPENLEKIERIKKIYHTKVFDAPHILFKALEEQKQRLEECMSAHSEYVSPTAFKEVV
jgi:phosphoenolpyruvate carboxykinase (GTP)